MKTYADYIAQSPTGITVHPGGLCMSDAPHVIRQLGHEVLGLMSGALINSCSPQVMKYVKSVLDTAIPRIPFHSNVEVYLSMLPTERANGVLLPLEIQCDISHEFVLSGFIVFMPVQDTEADLLA